MGTVTDPWRVPRREAWGAAALLVAVLALMHYDVLFEGRSLIASNFYNPIDPRHFPENYGNHVVPAEEWLNRGLEVHANLRDAGAAWWQWEPGAHFLKAAMRDGEWPFWDPYIAAGTPAMANLVGTLFFPPYTLVVALGASVELLNAYYLLIPWTASFFTFLFVRRHGVGFLAAAAGALAVMTGGAMQQNLGSFFGQVAACLPVTLHATRWFLDRPGPGRTSVLTLVYAGAALSSFPPMLVGIFGITALYALVALVNESGVRGLRHTGARWCGAVAVSIGMVAFYYLPAIALRAATPQMQEVYRDAGLETMPALHLYQILSPTLMGGVQTYLQPPLGDHGRPGDPHIPYAGLAVAALAFFARSSGDHRRRTLLLASAGTFVLFVLKLLGAPGVQWIGLLPFLNELHIAYYFAVPLGFLLACLAVTGTQTLIEGSSSLRRAALVALAVLALPASLWAVAQRLGVFAAPSSALWIRDWRVLMGVGAGCAAASLLAVLFRYQPRARTAATAALLAILIGEGLYNSWYPNPARWSLFEYPPPPVRVVQRTVPFDRVFSIGAIHANLNSAFGIYSLDSMMAFNPPRVWRLYAHYTRPQQRVFMDLATILPPEAVLDRANVALVGLRGGYKVAEAEERGYEKIFDDGHIAWFRRPTLPPFWYSSEYQVLPAAEALEAVARAPSRTVILEEAPGFTAVPNAPDDPPVTIVERRRNTVTLVVDAPRPGLVYASESFFAGWSARVNGADARILPANYAFRAVAVPAGRSRIEFTYWPPGLSTGLRVSALSVLTLIVWTAFRSIPRRRP